MNDFIHASFVLLAIPLLSILVPAALTWARDLSALSRRIRQVEEQTRVVAFWENWLRVESSAPVSVKNIDYEAERLISEMKSTVRRELADAGRSVLAVYKLGEVRLFMRYPLTFRQFRRYRAKLSAFKRAFLLYKAPNPEAKIAHLFFHAVMVENVMGIGIALSALLPNTWWTSLLPALRHRDSTLGNHSLSLLFVRLFLLLALISVVSVWARSRAIRHENNRLNYVRDHILARYEAREVQK